MLQRLNPSHIQIEEVSETSQSTQIITGDEDTQSDHDILMIEKSKHISIPKEKKLIRELKN